MNIGNISRLLAVAATLAAFGSRAEEETIDDYVWSYQIVNGTAEITKVSPSPTGSVSLPETLGGKTVTGIGWNAFLGCSGMKDVTIPAGVTSIAGGAFSYCSALTAFAVADGNSAFKAVDGLLLTADGQELVAAPGGIESAQIPDGVAVIGYHAFDGCISLESVTIPDGVARIGAGAFSDCLGLGSVTIPNSVTNIEYCAFLNCSGVTNLSVGGHVTLIGNSAFFGCSGLQTVELPDYFKDGLEDKVFVSCSKEEVEVTYREPTYAICFHRNDASDGAVTNLLFAYGKEARLPSLANTLKWARRGFNFLGWALSAADANAGKVWKQDWAMVTSAAEIDETLDVWAVWELKSDCYAIRFIRNDGAGTWRTVGFKYGEKTRIPSLANGLGWPRRGYAFKGWELTTANANDNTREAPWKADWAYVSTAAEAGETLTVYARWELKEGYYQIRFNKNDGSGKWRSLGFAVDTNTKLSTIAALGWERAGYGFLGWASNKANADEGKVWKTDGQWVTNAIGEGKTLSIYAIWE